MLNGTVKDFYHILTGTLDISDVWTYYDNYLFMKDHPMYAIFKHEDQLGWGLEVLATCRGYDLVKYESESEFIRYRNLTEFLVGDNLTSFIRDRWHSISQMTRTKFLISHI